MCPVCMTTAVVLASGAASTGGLAALVVKRIHPRPASKLKEPMITPINGEPHEPTTNRQPR
jgi:hypothetical protein